MLEPRILGLDHKPGWDRLWGRAGEPLGLSWAFPDLVAGSLGAVRRIGLFTSGGEMVAGTQFVLRRHRWMTLWAHAAPAPWGGILCDPESARQETFLREVAAGLGKVLSRESLWAQLILSPEVRDARPFLWADPHWSARVHYNYLNRIDSPTSLEEGAEGSVRRQARKAREAGVEFREGADLLPAFARLFAGTRQRQGFARILGDEALRQLADPTTGGWLVGVMRGEDMLAGAVIRTDRERAYYLVGASESAQDDGSGAPTLLHIEATRRLFERRGAFVWDWVGANTPSVAQFKKKFRPELEMSLRVTWRRGLGNLIRVGR
ncbi:hypothetical protein GC173_06040 [bacterium]|nr:hypothetical protein [bacterium]